VDAETQRGIGETVLNPLPDAYHRIISIAIDAEGVFPHQCIFRCGEKQTMAALDLNPAETVYSWLRQTLAKEKPDELIFGLDRFCKPGQGTTLGDCITGAWLAVSTWNPFVIEYQHEPRIVKQTRSRTNRAMVIKPLTLWLLRNLTMRRGEYIWRTPYGEPVTSWPPALFSWRKHMKAKDSTAADRERLARGKFLVIPIDDIESSPTNPRKAFDQAELQELAESIKANGVLQNVIVRPMAGATTPPQMRYELVAGERRWRAAQLAGLDTIPATVRDLTDAQVLEIQVIENEQRSDLSPLEKARGYQRLLGMPEFKEEGVKLLAQKVGKSAATIYGLIKLLELPEKAQKSVESGELPMSTAQLIARVPDQKARAQLANDAVHKDPFGQTPSYRGIKQRIQNTLMIELKQAPFSQSDETLSPAAGTCDACPKRTGNNRTDYPEGRADVCTDPSCYRGKLEVHRKRTLEAARDDGLKVLTGKEAEKALGYDSTYYDLKSQPWQDKKNRSFKQLLAGELDDKRVLIVDAKGERHFLVPKKHANETIKKKHKITLGSGPASVEDQAERRKRMDAGKARRLKQRALLKAIAEKAEERFHQAGVATTDLVVNDLLREECRRVIQATWSNMRDLMWPRHGAKGRAGEMTQHMLQVIQPLTAPALLAFLVESAAARSIDAPNGPWKTLGIDRKKIEAQAAAEAKAPKPSANGHAAKAATMSAPLKAPALEYWEIRYHLKNIGTASILACGSYADACEFAARDPAFKKVASCEKITKEEMDRRTQERMNNRGKKKPAKKKAGIDVNDVRGMFAKGLEPELIDNPDGDELMEIDNADGDVARCCVCRCTEDSPCEGGCYWVEGDDMEDRCNRCVGKPIPRGEGQGREASKYDPTKDPHAPLALFALSKKAKAALKPLAAAGIVTKSNAIFLCNRLNLEACAALETIQGVSRAVATEIGARLKESVRELQETAS
jgi:ParB/RepB/Spo0J family partition protein